MDDNVALRALPVAVTASLFATSVLLVLCDGCHSFFLTVSATGGARKRPQTEPHLDLFSISPKQFSTFFRVCQCLFKRISGILSVLKAVAGKGWFCLTPVRAYGIILKKRSYFAVQFTHFDRMQGAYLNAKHGLQCIILPISGNLVTDKRSTIATCKSEQGVAL